ncbi:Putative peroxiredoxin [Paraglaciecola mesophila]|uniref:thioredoxin-dependent peroxiredoxin n=1 Tax=Paraglaciecola mesophila TaxID=197222 RepID=A0A857JLF9_9ALTE|nr:peroxiredoxin-like family protein [Paraglaciecola mesophila]QHJ12182.1 Putative peroxiredoxin [Paraglaciecola mesophila]
MSLQAQIAEYDEQKNASAPKEILELMASTTQELMAAGLANDALQVGDYAPDFSLPNVHGELVTLAEMLAHGPVVLNFYRGGWCPYCNYELRAFEEVLERIEELGSQLVAISPETPDNSLTTKDKNELSYAVLSDVGNNVSNDYGLVFSLDERLRPVYKNSGVDLPASNGDDTFNLPMPATYVINQSGEIVYAFVSEDYTKRAEPSEVVKILTTLDN